MICSALGPTMEMHADVRGCLGYPQLSSGISTRPIGNTPFKRPRTVYVLMKLVIKVSVGSLSNALAGLGLVSIPKGLKRKRNEADKNKSLDEQRKRKVASHGFSLTAYVLCMNYITAVRHRLGSIVVSRSLGFTEFNQHVLACHVRLV